MERNSRLRRIEAGERLRIDWRRLHVDRDIQPHRSGTPGLGKVYRLFEVIPDGLGVENRHRVFRDRFDDRHDIHFLHAHLSHATRVAVGIEHTIGPLHLARNEQAGCRVDPCAGNAGNGIRTAWTAGHQSNPKLVGSLAVILSCDRAGLLMGITDRLDLRPAAEGFVQMHGASARHQEDVLDSLVGDEADHIVRKLHGFTECARTPAAFACKTASTSSRTAPLPPFLRATKAASMRTAGTASAGAAGSPTIFIASISFTSSPMKQISLIARTWRSAKQRRACALSLQFFSTSAMPILSENRSTSGLFSPDTNAMSKPDFRAREIPITSVKQKRFHSSPSGPHQNPPSVRTPSTSSTMARISFIARQGRRPGATS